MSHDTANLPLIPYLCRQQDDWRYYDMVWINDLDSTGCNVFVDGSIKSVSCDFMLPTLCEMDEHVRLTAFPSSVAELSLEVRFKLTIN